MSVQNNSWCRSRGFLRVAASSNPAVNRNLRMKPRKSGYLERWGSPSVCHSAVGHRKFSRSTFAASGACSSPCRQRRLLVPSPRKGHALARRFVGFGSRLPLHRRCVRSPLSSSCRVALRPASCRSGEWVPVLVRRVPLGVSCAVPTPRRVRRLARPAACRGRSLSGAAASSALGAHLPSVSVSRRVTVLPLVARRFVGSAAPTHRSRGAAQEAAQPPQLRR